MGLFPNELLRLTHWNMAEMVLEWLETHPQLRVSHDNRLSRQCQLIVKSKGIIENSHPHWRTFVQSLKDLQEYWFVIQVLGERLLQSPLLDRLVNSMSDSTLPTDSRASSPGRDAQFELFMAAIGARAGLEVDRPGDARADWIMAAPTGRWSLEAKRIKSFKKIEAHVRKAARQIVTSHVGGVIALDISLAVNPSSAPLRAFMPDSELEKWHARGTNALVNETLHPIAQWIGAANVGFVLLHYFVIRPAQDDGGRKGPWGLIGLWSKVDTITCNCSGRERYDDLWHLFQAALPNL
jgi:hypothetical protein